MIRQTTTYEARNPDLIGATLTKTCACVAGILCWKHVEEVCTIAGVKFEFTTRTEWRCAECDATLIFRNEKETT
jgi:hypothetical protein